MSVLLNHYDFLELLKQRQYELNEQVKKRKITTDKKFDGTLKVSNRGSYYNYYIRKKGESTGKYIKKSNMKLVRNLAQKKYDTLFVKEAEKELKTIRKFLKDYSDNIPNICNDFGLELKKSIDVADMSDEEYAEYWLSLPYYTKGITDGLPEHITVNGEHVRSKSEEIIANTLYRLKIPYKYEYPVRMFNGESRYPDFTILDVKKRKEFYYEHFGMMDDMDYFVSFVKRLMLFEKSGIYPGENLIMTFETSDVPVNTQYIERVIRKYIDV